jgi:hypothetical protein
MKRTRAPAADRLRRLREVSVRRARRTRQIVTFDEHRRERASHPAARPLVLVAEHIGN